MQKAYLILHLHDLRENLRDIRRRRRRTYITDAHTISINLYIESWPDFHCCAHTYRRREINTPMKKAKQSSTSFYK